MLPPAGEGGAKGNNIGGTPAPGAPAVGVLPDCDWPSWPCGRAVEGKPGAGKEPGPPGAPGAPPRIRLDIWSIMRRLSGFALGEECGWVR